MKKEIEQFITKGIRSKIDNYALQKIIWIIEEAKLKTDDLVIIQLSKCPHCSKQRVLILGEEDGECFFCEKPIDEEIIVYQVEDKKQIICLESEAEELINKHS